MKHASLATLLSLPVAALALLSCGGGGGGGESPPDPRWSRLETANAVQQTDDGGFVVAGYVADLDPASPDGPTGDLFLLKTDPGGTVLWVRKFGGAGDDWAGSVQQTADGGYLVAGYTDSFGAGDYDAYLIKTDASGNTVWERTFGSELDDGAFSVVQIAAVPSPPDPSDVGSYMVVGARTGADGSDDLWVLKVDPDGELLWEMLVEGEPYSLRGYQIIRTADGGYAIAGEWTNNVGYHQMLVVRLQPNGTLDWQNTYGGDFAWSLRQTADNGFIVAGNDASLVKTGADGSFQWTRSYRLPDPGPSRFFHAVELAPDGGYVAVGTGGVGSADQQAYMIKTDGGGYLEWERDFGLQTGGDLAHDVKPVAGGGYVLAGWTGSYGYMGDVLLIRTDAAGGSPQWIFVSDSIPLD